MRKTIENSSGFGIFIFRSKFISHEVFSQISQVLAAAIHNLTGYNISTYDGGAGGAIARSSPFVL